MGDQAKVPNQASKKQILLDFFHARATQHVETKDLHAARNELRRHLGPGDKTSLGYIATVLRKAGYEVQYEDAYSDPILPEPYASRLKGVLEFHNLSSAEQSLRRIDAMYREYSRAADRVGAMAIRALVKKGRLRARSLAANPRVQAPKRKEKQEIAHWFQVWLETPDLFADWLALRKTADEFLELAGGGNSAKE